MDDVSSLRDRVGFYLFTFCVVFAPIPFGSTETAVAGFVGLLLAASLLVSVSVPMASEGLGRLFRSAALLSGIVVLGCLAHVIPWDLPSMAGGSQNAKLVDGLDQMSAARYQALYAAGYVLIPLAGFMCALVYIRDDKRYMLFVQIVLVANLVVTLLCIGQHVVSPRSLLWAERRHYTDSFTGTFVNPNTAATYFGFLFLMALALSARRLERVNLHRLFFSHHRASPDERHRLNWLIAYAFATLVFLLALLLTKSRAGIVASLVGAIGFVAAFTYFVAKGRASIARAVGVSVLCVLGVVSVFALLGERFLLRLQDQGLVEEGRLCTYGSTWNAIKEGPWWGAGLGTFQDYFPAYRSPACGLYGHWEMAHSVFLEAWFSLGITFLACAALAYYHLVRTFSHGVRVRRRLRFVPLGCFGLLLILTLHSLVDFSLQVPGFALMAAAALGTGAAISLGTRT